MFYTELNLVVSSGFMVPHLQNDVFPKHTSSKSVYLGFSEKQDRFMCMLKICNNNYNLHNEVLLLILSGIISQ